MHSTVAAVGRMTTTNHQLAATRMMSAGMSQRHEKPMRTTVAPSRELMTNHTAARATTMFSLALRLESRVELGVAISHTRQDINSQPSLFTTNLL